MAVIAAGQSPTPSPSAIPTLSATSTPQYFDDGSGPADYAPDTHLSWLIVAPEGQVVVLEFTGFDTDDFDYVQPSVPFAFASSSRAMRVTFDSGPSYFDDGSGPADYASDTHVSWLITAPEGQSVRIIFAEFSTDYYDFVRGFDGTTTSAPVLFQLYGQPSLPLRYRSTENAMLVTFDSSAIPYGSFSRQGFNASYFAEFAKFTLTATSTPQYFGDGSGPANYAPDTHLSWLIIAPEGHIVRIMLTQFVTSYQDNVRGYDGNTTAATLLFEVAGELYDGPYGYRSTGRVMLYFDDGSGAANYAPNTHISWFISAPFGQFVRVQFNSFDTELALDFVRGYDGSSANDAQRIFALSGQPAVPFTYASSGSSMLVTFDSGSAYFDDGSGAANYAPVTRASWLVTAPEGQVVRLQFISFDTELAADFVRPGFSASYTAALYSAVERTLSATSTLQYFDDGSGADEYTTNTHISWLISAPSNHWILLQFTSFDTESGQDYVRGYDGNSIAARQLFAVSGQPSAPFAFASSGGSMRITFDSGPSVQMQGFNVSATSTPQYFDDGSGPADYAPDTHVSWLIVAPEGQVVVLEFTGFKTESDFDYVRGYDGNSSVAQQLFDLSGEPSMPVSYTSTGNTMLVTFDSDSSIQLQGFNATYTAVVPVVQFEFNATSTPQYFDDGSGPADYASDTHISWLIVAPEGQVVVLEFTGFKTESDLDYVRGYDGNSSVAQQLFDLSGEPSMPVSYTSTGNTMLVTFDSDSSIQLQGFNATYTAVVPVVQFEFNATSTPQYFDDGSGPADYAPHMDISCFDTESGQDYVRGYDGMRSYDGSSNAARQLFALSGQPSAPLAFASSGGSMLVTFDSGPSVQMQGFNVSYTAVMYGVQGSSNFLTATSTPQYFDDGSGPSSYTSSGYMSTTTSWLITAPEGHVVSIQFLHFDTESGYYSDYVTGYDGTTTAAAELFGIYGQAYGMPVGYRAVARTLNATGALQYFDDGSGAANYAPHTHISWLITAPEGQVVRLQFASFDTELASDYVRGYDGSSANDVQRIFALSGQPVVPFTYVSLGSSMLVTFDSGPSVQMQGFNVSYTAGRP
eukprot:tig00001071_g6793.t1